jgi:O-antigen ligase
MATTRNELGKYAGLTEETTHETTICPPALFEYVWYVILVYGALGQAWGVVIPSVNGTLLMLLAAACLFTGGVRAPRLYAPVAFALCTGISVIAVQVFFHSEMALSNSIPFIGWLSMVIIVQSLALRPRFLNRFALVAFAIGLACWPYIQLNVGGGGLMRARATGTAISNANVLGMWFGFCTVYFVFWGLQSRGLILRAVSWIVGLGCLYVVTLTVSRGPLLGIVLACVVGLRSALKRYFVPVLSLVLLVWLVYASGVFQETIDFYSARGAVETGRGIVWPLALQRIFDSPWTGVGFDSIFTSIRRHKAITPHNALLYIGLAAGIIPVICYLGYLARAVTGALHIMRRVHVGEATLLPPLVVFALLEIMIGDASTFMSPWVVVVFSLAAGASQAYDHQRSMTA